MIVPMAVCPKCCTNLYQELEKVPSLENASTTPMPICDFCYKILGEFYPDFLSLSCIRDFYQDLRLMVKIYSFFTISFENFCQG